MLSHSSAIEKRRQTHRRQNSTPAIFDAAQIRPPAALLQRQVGHRRGMSYDQNARTIGPLSPRHHISVSIPETIQQHPQHHMQEAQQQSNVQPGSPFPQTPLSARFPSQQQPHTPSQTPQQTHQPSVQDLKDLEEHIKRVYGVNGNVYVSILPTPASSPEKPAPLPIPEEVELKPMPTSLGSMADLSLNPPMGDPALFDSDPVEFMENEGYESSYYSSDALSPARSPTCSPQQKSITDFLEQVRNPPRLTFPLSNSSSFPPAPLSANEVDPFYCQSSPPSSPRQRALSEFNINGSVLDTGFSDNDIERYMSEQNVQTGKWTCQFEGCGKNFGRKENIRSHIQTHLGDRQFKCNYCDKCFVRSHDLKRHVLIHSDEKPYACQCGSRFARQDALTRHRQRGMCEGGIHNPSRGSARRGRPRKERPDMQKRVDKANKTRKALASAPQAISQESPLEYLSSPEPSQELPEVQSSWASQSFEQFSNNTMISPEPSSDLPVGDEIVNNIYRLASDFVSNNTPPMSATDSPSPLSISSPEFSSEPDSSFSRSFFDTSAGKLDDIFTGFVPSKDVDWVEEMMNGDAVF